MVWSEVFWTRRLAARMVVAIREIERLLAETRMGDGNRWQRKRQLTSTGGEMLTDDFGSEAAGP